MANPYDYQDNLERALERAIAIFDVLAVFKSSELAEEVVEPLADLGRDILWAAKKETNEAFAAESKARKVTVAPAAVFRPESEQKKIVGAMLKAAKKIDAKKGKKRAA